MPLPTPPWTAAQRPLTTPAIHAAYERESGTPFEDKSSTRVFLLTALLIGSIYSAWLLALWPGILGQDSLAIILEIEKEGFQSGKPIFWYLFVKFFYAPAQLVEIPIGVQMLLCSIIFSRILTWCWVENLKKTFVFLLIFICLAPNMIFFAASLYADAIFAAAVSGLLFELWLVTQKNSKMNLTSTVMIFLTFPFASFSRPNGMIFLVAVVAALFFLGTADKLKILTIIVAWTTVVFVGDKFHPTEKHATLYPLAIFETVNFLQPRAMNLPQEMPRVSDRTVKLLTQYQPIRKIVENYDRDYWDSLIFKTEGPHLNELSLDDKQIIIKEFFRYNVWHNFPAFFSSRVNIFLVALLAQGGIQSQDYAAYVITYTKSQSEFRKFHLQALESVVLATYKFTYAFRFILWTPLIGIVLLTIAVRVAWRSKDTPMLLITVPMVIQLGAIFFFSIAGEYRYLLPFFTLPLVLMPVLAVHRKRQRFAAASRQYSA